MLANISSLLLQKKDNVNWFAAKANVTHSSVKTFFMLLLLLFLIFYNSQLCMSVTKTRRLENARRTNERTVGARAVTHETAGGI